MKEYRLLIIEPDIAYANFLADRLARHPGIRIVGTEHEGVRALGKIRRQKPDLVLMEPMVSGMDGICLLKAMQKMKQPPTTVCFSSFYSAISVESARRSGASYFVYKPVESDSLATILLNCAESAEELRRVRQSQVSLEEDARVRNVYAILRELGFNAKYSGSRYLLNSVILSCESPMLLHNLSSGLYRRLSEQTNVSPAAIERSIRTAISAADESGALTERLGAAPTNKSCIQCILRILNQNA